LLARNASSLDLGDVEVLFRALCRLILIGTTNRAWLSGETRLGQTHPDVQSALSLVVGDHFRQSFLVSDLSYSDLRGADLIGAWLVRANLQYVKLDEARLVGAKLRDSDLSHSSLRGAKAIRADLRGANLHSASFIDADLRWSNLENTCLTSTDLASTQLEGARLAGSFGADTKWPDKYQRSDRAHVNSAAYNANLDKLEKWVNSSRSFRLLA
jgi:uncharacterized protein YjbI with pentapeptide repeats